MPRYSSRAASGLLLCRYFSALSSRLEISAMDQRSTSSGSRDRQGRDEPRLGLSSFYSELPGRSILPQLAGNTTKKKQSWQTSETIVITLLHEPRRAGS